MKKLASILIAGMMLTGVLGSANATLMKGNQHGGTKYNVSHTLGGFNNSYNWPKSAGILKIGKSYTKMAGFRKARGATWKKQVRWNKKNWGHKRGGHKHKGVPEPGMLALMALVLLGLGLGPWLRKTLPGSSR